MSELDLDSLKGHTKGPWNYVPQFNEDRESPGTDYLMLDSDGEYVATVIDFYHDGNARRKEKKANTELMIAAPELLELAKKQRDEIRALKMEIANVSGAMAKLLQRIAGG